MVYFGLVGSRKSALSISWKVLFQYREKCIFILAKSAIFILAKKVHFYTC